MIWDYIRDFIVQYLTGGNTSTGEEYSGTLGYAIMTNQSDEYVNEDVITTAYTLSKVGSNGDFNVYTSFGDWLATTITAVIMVLMVVLACLLVRWIFKLVVNGFLLKR